jgi:hypothetical protein
MYRVDNLTNRGVIRLLSKVPILQQHYKNNCGQGHAVLPNDVTFKTIIFHSSSCGGDQSWIEVCVLFPPSSVKKHNDTE